MIYKTTYSFIAISFKKKMQPILILIWFAILGFPFFGLAQNPGGVPGDVIWFKANSGITLNGSNVSQWNDFSGNGNNGTQVTAGNQPAYTANGLNFNQVTTFSTSNYLITPTNNLPSGNSPRSIFLVASSTNTQTVNSWIYGYGTGAVGRAFNVGKTTTSTSLYASSYSNDALSSTGFWVADVPKLGTVTYNAPTVSFFDAGDPIGTSNQSGWNTLVAVNSGRIGNFANSGGEYWRGNIAEIILYPSLITGTSATSVESYLAIKYGIHKTGNYLSSSGTIVWDAANNSVYHNDVFGIAQDDASGLLQTQSNSANTGSGDGTGQTGKGNIVINNPSALANNGFLIIGHDTNALTEANVTVGGQIIKRVLRNWKVQTTGNVGTVALSYDTTGLTYSAVSASDYVLLVDPTGTGNFDGGTVVKYSGASISGNKVSFTTVDLPTGSVFTFQTSVVLATQAINVNFTGTAGTATTANWTNGSGASRVVFIHQGVSASPIPVDGTTYTANTTFASGTQIGTTGWYCVYNGTGTTVNITGLNSLTTYQVMTLEYNGSAGSELYLSAVSTGNPASVTTTSILGPGGVGTNLRLWLKANSSVTPATQGASVTTWNDQSGGNNNAVFSTPMFSQTVLNPSYQLNSLNFNPALYFNGTSSTNIAALGGSFSPAVTSNNISAYVVFLMNTPASGSARILMISQNSATPDWQNQTGADLISRFGNNAYGKRNNTDGPIIGPVVGTPVVLSTHFTANNQWFSEINGDPFTTVNYSSTALNSAYYRIGLSTYNANDYLNGNIAEIILYDVDKSSSISHNQIESYLSLKYGIHKLGNYVNSSNVNIWDALNNIPYNNDVFGLGQDDLSGLLQTQSNSVNTGNGDGSGQSGKGNIVISNPSSLVNNGFLMIGHNTGALTEINATIAGGINAKIIQRIWKVQTTGTTGNIALTYDITGLTYSAQSFSDYVLLVDPTGTGNFAGGSVVQYPAASISNNKISFSSVVLPTGAVFTFKTLSSPTVQATNVNFTNTTGIATTANWTNGNGTSRVVFIHSGVSASPLPVNGTTYTANTAFASGTQIGTTGWYCVYNGSGTTVNVTGLTPATIYQVMTLEYNGSSGSELYLTSVSTGNPANVTTLNNDATLSNLEISSGTLNPVFVPTSTSYSTTVPNAVTSITLTPTTTDSNATVTVNGVTVLSGNASGAIALVVGSNLITTVVTAQDGTTIETYTVIVTRTEPTIVTAGTLSAITTIYGTPSTSQTFNVSGTDMFDGILITAPSGFEVSNDNIAFSNTVTIGAVGDIISTPVYIRLKGTIAVGSYSGDVTLTSNGAVTVNVSTVTSTVTPAPLTITADNYTKIYGSVNPTLTVTYTGFVNGDTAASLTTLATISTTAVTGSPVGTYPITASGAVNTNYTINYLAGNLTINEAILTITADNQSKLYGAAIPILTVSYAGFVNGDTSITTAPSVATTADASSPAGTYPITASGASDLNYTISYVDGTLTVNTAALTITADNQSKTYGDTNPVLTVSYAGFVNGDTSITTAPSVATTADASSPAGTYPITASGASDPNYTISYVDGTLTVTPALLTITADNQSKTYGDTNPVLTVSYSGFVNGNTSIITAPTVTTTADTASPAGTYPITASGASDPNYTISYVDGTLTVNTAALTITADNQSKTYGDTNPVLTVSYSGFVNGDTSVITAPTVTTTADTASPAGTYPITASGASDPNYTISYVDGTLTVSTASLTITADNQSKTYGDTNPVLTVSYAGFVNGDTAPATAPTVATTADASSPAGTYPITASGASDPNYTISYVDGTLTVTPALLTITADNQSKTYGSANPVLTVSYTGFVNGDTSITTVPSVTTTADASSPAGTYPITPLGASDPNYTISFVDGTLTVNTASLTITADDQSKTYGSANPALTVSYSGFVNGDTSITTSPTVTTTADTANPAGTYPITASGASDPNYIISYVDGTLTVNTAALTITADNQSKTYGSANPSLTVSYSGFVNGDTSITTAPSVTTTADPSSPAGIYPITASGASDPNYTISYVDGTLTVNTASLTITADDQSKTYGSANPALTVSYTGFVNGDTSITTAPSVTTTADASSPAGIYPITASGASDPNYTISYVDGTLTVTSVLLTITADNQSKTYGSANPALTVSYSGFVNGDTAPATAPSVTTTADASSPAGTYPITASGASDPNYTISYVDGTLTVTPVLLTITADNQNKTYGSANPALTVSYAGFVNGDTSTAVPPIISTTADASSPAGTYPITASGASDPNYTISYVEGTLTVTPALLTITADDQSKTYGSANPALTVSYAGFVNGDTAPATAPSVTTTADTASPAGIYPITASGASDPNYTISYVDGTLTVNTASLTITGDNQSKIYGSANPVLTVSYTGFVNGDTAPATAPSVTTTADTASPAGTYPITASGASDPNYTISYVDGTFTVSTASLTITADNQSKTYGDTNPVLTVSYSGFVNGDTSTAVPPIISTAADALSPAGTYPITASGASDPNYTIVYVAGTLTVTPALLTITADNQSKTYGSANPALTVSYSGFVNGDTSIITAPTITTTADASSPAGTYPITASGASDPNYTISYVDGTLTVNTAALTITADNQSKTYGDTNPVLTVSYAGFVNGDTAPATAPTVATTADASSPAGTYPITASGASDPNYTISYVDGTLTVNTAALTITADNQSKTYGSANPALTVSYTGFVNGDTSITTVPSVTTTADASSPAGTYPITPLGASDPNYTISFVDGTLTVNTASLTITADDQSKTYGSANPALTVSYSGFVNGDTSITTSPTVTTTADTANPAGTYPITASGASDPNYIISYVDGTLTVNTAALTITADNQSKTYGSANPSLTVSYSGFVNGDTSITTAPSVTTTADPSSPAGIYPITASGASDPNYTISYVDGTLTVNTASLTITADDQSKTYGSANPALTVSYTGFVNGDTSITTAPSVTTTADASSPAGIYPITASGASDPNYTISYVDGTLTVTSVLLTITADNQSKTYGSANPALTVSYSGFVNGDTAPATAPSVTTTADASSPAGTYPITASGASDPNYTISYVDGTLTVTPVLLTITADNQNKTYGSANPALTVSYAGFVNGDTSTAVPPIISTTADASSPAGTYPITASGASDPNYTISYVEGTLTVTPALLTITADDQSKTYGSANPALTVSYAGFVNGDTAPATAPSVTTTADTASPAGIYPITASGASDPNYTISYVDGTLTVNTASLTITGDNQSKIYGSANPVLTVSYAGFVNGDTAPATAPSVTTTADTASPAGTYPITASGASDPNYTISYVDGTLTVNTAALTITADNQSKTYGSANPALTVSYSGFVNGDTSTAVPPIISTAADALSPADTYPITASGASDPNYTIVYVAGTLTVTPALLTITADNQSKTYGSANPALTVSYSGFVNGDIAPATAPTVTTTADTASPAGTYPITASGASDPNYTIVYVAGTLTVTPALLTITADNQSKTYGSANPALTVTYSGFVNGDTSITTAPSVATTADASSPAGTYPVTASGASDLNYTISYVDGTLTVNAAALSITADNQSKTYGSSNPSLTVSYSGFVNGDTSVITAPTVTTTADTASPAGTYPITASGASDPNYTIIYVDGTLTINSGSIDVDLTSLTINNGVLNPAFSPDILVYNVTVGNSINTEMITVVDDDPLAAITINGTPILSGGSLTASLTVGLNTMVVKIVGEDGITTKTYTVNITREGSNNATLVNLTISEGVLKTTFEPDITNYNATVGYNVNSITVTPTATDSKAKITVNGIPVSSGTASAPIILNSGENTIETVVIAEDGLTKQTYTIVVYKGVSPDALVINNILSLNGDGKNDFWKIEDIELFPNNVVTVYDRAGRIMYTKKGYNNDWGGLYNGSPLNNDTYYYLIDLGDNIPKIKGFITIIESSN